MNGHQEQIQQEFQQQIRNKKQFQEQIPKSGTNFRDGKKKQFQQQSGTRSNFRDGKQNREEDALHHTCVQRREAARCAGGAPEVRRREQERSSGDDSRRVRMEERSWVFVSLGGDAFFIWQRLKVGVSSLLVKEDTAGCEKTNILLTKTSARVCEPADKRG